MYKILKISILLFFPLFLFAQKSAKEWRKDADTYLDKQCYERSLAAYLEYRKLNPKDNDIYPEMGKCAYEIGAYDDAKRFLTYAFEQKSVATSAYLSMGKTMQALGEYKDAIANYKKYLTLIKSSASDRRMVKDEIKRCASGLNFTDNNSKVFVQNMGDKVNSDGDDFGPIISPNSDEKIYFSSARSISVGGLRDEEGIRDSKFGQYCADIYTTKISSGDWAEPKALSYLINSPRHDVALDFSKDGTLMFYYKGFNLFSGEIYVDTFKTFDERTLNSTPLNSPMNGLAGDGTPFFANDSVMIFSSRRSGGFGGADLYYSIFQNEKWSDAKNFGNNVNSGYDEVSPFLATDGRTLYFSSNHTNGIGDFDIYKCIFDDKTLAWSLPENLGIPINSAGEDAFFRLTKDGTKGFFSSKRKDGYGKRDLYTAYYKSPLAEQVNLSEPDFFFKVKPTELANSNQEDENAAAKIITYKFYPIVYDKDADLLSGKNKATLDAMIDFLNRNENVKVTIVSHSDETTNIDLDAFLSVKRAEKISEFMVKNACKAQQINILGCGSSFPIADNVSDGQPNKIGQKLNRRLELFFHNYQKLPVKLEFDETLVPEYMQSDEHFRFKNIYKGLSYRVQVASMKQMYQGDVLRKYPDVTVEKNGIKDTYDFSIGMFTSFQNADRLQKDLQAQGINAIVVPYISGLSVVDTVKNYSSQYPDLQNFMKNKK